MTAPMSFFTRPPPLGDARTVPAIAAPKRASLGPLPVAKRAKVNTVKKHPESLSLVTRALTPEASDAAEPSSDIDSHPMHPAMSRIRAPPTPTTSTVAASSSPNRRLAMSSPRSTSYRSKSRTTSPAVPVLLDESTTLIFGRHRHQPKGVAPPPAVLVPRLLNVANPARTISLDRAARHASRVHAAVELVETAWGAVVRVIVLGQNGVRVRHGIHGRRRLRCGTVTEFTTEGSLEIDFYGAAVLIRTEEERERLFTPEPQVARAGPARAEPARAESPISLPPSSPPMLMESLMEDSDADMEIEVEQDEEQVSAPTPGADRFSRSSSPLSEPEDEDERTGPSVMGAAAVLTPAFVPGPAPSPNIGLLSSPCVGVPPSPAPTVASPLPTLPTEAAPGPSRTGTPRPAKSRQATPAVETPPFPAGLDLPALLATTVVFSGSSKLSLPDLVKSLLESQPALRDHGDDKAWSHWAAAELDTNTMFGKVARNGKDVSGRPLLPHYFYNPAEDPDPARAKELGGLVRPLRAAQRTGGKVIDWRPVGSGRRRYW